MLPRQPYTELMSSCLVDSLTGLPSQSGWKEAIDDALVVGRDFGLVFLDLNRFAFVNHIHGHRAGDEALQGVANALNRLAPASRFGGNEFGLLVLEHPLDAVEKAARVAVVNAISSYETPALRDFAAKNETLNRSIAKRYGWPERPERPVGAPVLGATTVTLLARSGEFQTASQIFVALTAAMDKAKRTPVQALPR